MSSTVDCSNCAHFRSAPYQAKLEGCYHPEHMKAKQKQSFLNEQQIPGDHEAINRRGDCADFQVKPVRPSLWQRLLSIGA